MIQAFTIAYQPPILEGLNVISNNRGKKLYNRGKKLYKWVS